MIHARHDYDSRIQDSVGLIPADEPVLLIRGQDAACLAALDAWVEASMALGVDKDLLDSMSRHRQRILYWQHNIRLKVADADKGVLK